MHDRCRRHGGIEVSDFDCEVCMSAYDAEYLTPGELADLKIIRGRAMMDRGDVAPMQRITYRSFPTSGKAGAAFATDSRVIPWLEALNMEVD